MRTRRTLEQLKATGISGHQLDARQVVETALDAEVGTARYRIAPVIMRREMRLRVDPAEASVYEVEVSAGAILGGDIGSEGDAQKTATRNAIKARFSIGSNAEADRRIYRLVGRLLGLGGELS